MEKNMSDIKYDLKSQIERVKSFIETFKDTIENSDEILIKVNNILEYDGYFDNAVIEMRMRCFLNEYDKILLKSMDY